MFGRVPVPGATVSLIRDNHLLVTITDSNGTYRFEGVEIGTWTIRIEMLGFQTAEAPVTVAVMSAPMRFELTLRPLSDLARLSADVHLEESPDTNGRAADVAVRDTGAVSGASVAPPGQQPGSGLLALTPSLADVAITALKPSPDDEQRAADGFLVNGSVNNGAASPFAQLAAFGNNRRGTRSLYTIGLGLVYGASAFDARPFSFSPTPAPKPSYSNLQIAGTAAGPLKLPGGVVNRPNVFIGLQHRSDQQLTTQAALVPTLRERAGDFSQTRDRLGRPVELIDPATGRPFPGNAIPPDKISPQATALQSLYPVPNVDGGHYNYEARIPVVLRQDNAQIRVTQTVSRRSRISAYASYQRATNDTTSLLGFEDTTATSSLNAGVNWAQRLGGSFTLRLRYDLDRSKSDVTPYFAGRSNVSGTAGIVGNDQNPANWGPPTLVFSSGIATLSDALANATHGLAHTIQPEALWNHGPHNITVGGAVHAQRVFVMSQQDPRGTFGFTGAATGSDVADFLLGLPRTSSIAFGNPDKHLHAVNRELYVVDDLRLSRALTLNVGVRWEYEAPMSEAFGRLVNLLVGPSFTSVTPVVTSDGLLQPDWGGWQPRLGVAWRPKAGSSLVVRGGYGVYRNTAVHKPIALLLAQQPPLSRTFAVETTAANPVTLATGFLLTPGAVANTFAVDPHFRVGYAHMWQASVQRDLPVSLTVIATYLGAKGRHLMREFLPNTYPIGTANPCPACPMGFVYLESNGESTRHAIQLELRRRLRDGLTATVQYTLSQAIDDAGAFATPSFSGSAIAQDWRNLAAERAPSTFDQRHLVGAQVDYSTGVGRRGGGLLTGWQGALLKGWTFTGQLKAGSGLPATPVVMTSVPGTGVMGTIRADLARTPAGATPAGSYANPAAYALPIGHWGTAGRNSIRGPSQFGLNAGVAREFAIGERTSLEWRLDATNVLNAVTYGSINTIVGSPQFGLPTSANAMRRIQSTGRVRLRF